MRSMGPPYPGPGIQPKGPGGDSLHWDHWEVTLIIALLLAVSAWAGCDELLEISLRHAEKSYAQRDAVGVDSGLRDAQKNLKCVAGTVDPRLSARVHRVEAFAADLKGNRSRVDEHLRAMVHADPWLGLLDVIPADHPLQIQLIDAEEQGSSATRKLLWPEAGVIHVDGIPAAIAPSEHPWVYQQMEGRTTVLRTAWIDTGSSPPTPIGEVGHKAQVKNGWKIAGVTAGIAAGAMYGAAWAERNRYERAVAAGDEVTIRDAYSMANGLTIGSVVTGGAGAAMIGIGFAL